MRYKPRASLKSLGQIKTKRPTTIARIAAIVPVNIFILGVESLYIHALPKICLCFEFEKSKNWVENG